MKQRSRGVGWGKRGGGGGIERRHTLTLVSVLLESSLVGFSESHDVGLKVMKSRTISVRPIRRDGRRNDSL
jgi:hypothetical protein